MEKTKYIWHNGHWQWWEKSMVHVITNALHYGTGVFEGLRVYQTDQGPAIFRLQDHLKRFLYSAQKLKLEVPYPLAELVAVVQQLVSKNHLIEGYIRPLIFFGGPLYMGLQPHYQHCQVETYFACWPWPPLLGTKPLKCGLSPFRRLSPLSFDPKAKVSGVYFNSVMSNHAVIKAGFDEAIMLDQEGYIAEGSSENIFFVKDKTLYTPQEGSLLPGITRQTVMVLAKELGIKVREIRWKLKDLTGVEEAFFTGTGTEVAPVASIDKKVFKESFGPVTKILRNAYLDLVHGRNKKYKNWLTFSNK